MRLTPADVHNVAFKKPSIGKRGYDEDEVDAFLDIVEAELTRLIEENNELRQQVAALESGQVAPGGQETDQAAGPAPESGTDGQSVQDFIASAPADGVGEHEMAADQAGADQASPDAVSGPADEPVTAEQPVVDQTGQPAAPVAAAPVIAAQPAAPADHHLQAARLLGLAQETAERVTSEANAEAEQTKAAARAEADQLLGNAHHESDELLTNARNESERMLTEAKNNSETMVSEATAKAESTIRDSQIKAEAMDREAQRKYSEVMNQLTTQRTNLENKIDGLRTYEREYRSRLKNWITEQLEQLAASGGDTDAGSAEDARTVESAG